ncbi:MAG TPA: DUF2381 family protein [Myxococcaceae bacterium]|nr:DUF2381 family protein [Myxococcaceae bacterium]
MFLSAPMALAALTLLSQAPAAAGPPRLPECDEAQARLELATEPSAQVREVCISPGLTTTFVFFGGELQPEGVALEGAGRFTVVEPSKRTLSMLPSDKLEPGERLKLTMRFAGAEAPAMATFLLVVHPARATRQVEVFRHQRTLASYQQAEKEQAEKLQQCREENGRLHAQEGKPPGLTGLITSGRLGKEGVAARELVDHKLQPPVALEVWEAWSYRANGVVAVEFKLAFPEGTTPWAAMGAELARPSHLPLRVLSVWLEPVPELEQPTVRVVVEAEATGAELGGTFNLKLWNAPGPGSFTLSGVTFP